MKRVNYKKYAINLTGSPNSTLIKIKNFKFRALVDSDVEVSLILYGFCKFKRQT